MPNSWPAYYLDGQTATRHGITVTVTAQALHLIFDSGEIRQWPYRQICQTQGTFQDEPVRFEKSAEAIIFASPAILTAIHKSAPAAALHFHNPSMQNTRLYRTLGATLGVLLMVAGLYCWGIPSMAAVATPYVPAGWEDQLGRQVINHLAPEARQCHDSDRLRKLDHILETLAATRRESPYHIRLFVVDDPAVNAFATPGGGVVLFRGLLEKTDSPEQLAGILAHELQHIYQRHTTRAILEQTASTWLVTAMSGDLSGGVAWGLEGARIMGTLHYSRAHETEADAAGLHMLQAAGIDPAAMVIFYGILQDAAQVHEGPADFLSTHPNMQERLDNLMSLTGQPPVNAVTLLPGEDWHNIRTLCRLGGEARSAPVSLHGR